MKWIPKTIDHIAIHSLLKEGSNKQTKEIHTLWLCEGKTIETITWQQNKITNINMLTTHVKSLGPTQTWPAETGNGTSTQNHKLDHGKLLITSFWVGKQTIWTSMQQNYANGFDSPSITPRYGGCKISFDKHHDKPAHACPTDEACVVNIWTDRWTQSPPGGLNNKSAKLKIATLSVLYVWSWGTAAG